VWLARNPFLLRLDHFLFAWCGDGWTGVTMEEWLGCEGNAVIQHYRLSGVGHVWPEIASNATSGSNSASGFDASTAIWTFFAQRTLSPEQAPAA
jgi:poly(3-hydroxybutyrate) depolymerase